MTARESSMPTALFASAVWTAAGDVPPQPAIAMAASVTSMSTRRRFGRRFT